MRIWVSGARGKLGGEVQRQLEAAGHQVIPADLAGDEPVDLTDPAAAAASLHCADAIIHCAGIASPENIAPGRARPGTHDHLQRPRAGRVHGIRTAVLASSGSIYGPAWSPRAAETIGRVHRSRWRSSGSIDGVDGESGE